MVTWSADDVARVWDLELGPPPAGDLVVDLEARTATTLNDAGETVVLPYGVWRGLTAGR